MIIRFDNTLFLIAFKILKNKNKCSILHQKNLFRKLIGTNSNYFSSNMLSLKKYKSLPESNSL